MQITSPWIVQKLGLQDFWYYDEEEFLFEDGRMLLRGSNGSGKSVTMQSFIPLLLDGNKSAQRLDAFGSKERKLINYLLEEGDEREECTGYLYMEFKRQDSDTYLTIGMGNRARKNGTMTSWYFYITDGRRVHIDFDLYRTPRSKIALSQKELENRIGDGGAVLTAQKEYMNKINDMLFGFDTIENYQELLTLLIQLRQPKLSKDFKPTKLNEILTTSLTPLSEDDLRPMSEAVENMDAITTTLESLKESRKACEKIASSYEVYNQKLLYDKAEAYAVCCDKKASFLKEEEAAKKAFLHKQDTLASKTKIYHDLNIELQARKEEERNLRGKKAFQLKEQVVSYQAEEKDQEKQKQNNLTRLQEKQEKESELRQKQREKQNDVMLSISNMQETLSDMDAQSDEIFNQHDQLCSPLKANPQAEVALESLMRLAQQQQKRIQEAVSYLHEKENHMRQLKEQEEALEKEKQNREDKERELDKLEKLLLETKQELMEHINQWDEETSFLHLDSHKSAVFSAIEVFGFDHSYYEITDLLKGQKNLLEQRMQKDKNTWDLKAQKLQGEWNEKNLELQDWIHKEDPEPVRNEDVELNRQLLMAAGIPYHPLYKVIEFYPAMSEQLRDRLEEALEDMGLLDALVVEEQYRAQVMQLTSGKDRYIFTDPNTILHPLQNMLEPDPQINDIFLSSQITAILESISSHDEEGTFIGEDGTYGIGILYGRTAGHQPSRFIGYQSRQRYRKSKIDELTQVVQQLQIAIEEVQSAMSNIDQQLHTLHEEFLSFPKGDDLQEVLRMVKKCEDSLDAILQQMEAKKASVIHSQQRINELYLKITNIQNLCGFSGNLEIYNQAEIDMSDYIRNIHELQRTTMEIKSANEQIATIQNQLEDVERDIDERMYQLTRIEQLLTGIRQRIESIEAQLQDSDYANLQQRIDICMQRLDEIPQEREHLYGAMQVLEKEVADIHKNIQEFGDTFKKMEADFEKMESIFKEELLFGFVDIANISEEYLHVAKNIIATYPAMKGLALQNVFQQLSTKFHENKEFLFDYNLIQEESHSAGDDKRILLTARVSGVKITFYALYEQIQSDIQIQELLLSNKERELFEDILANTLGKKIRYKIQKSKDWVAMMNQSMAQMDISSNLKLSLEWKNKQAEEDGQMGTKELVDLLNMDSEMMSDGQMRKLAQHFRSKLVQARKRLEEKENIQTFHTIMRDIFDYRTWFEFQLYYEKGAEKRRELTNSRFLVFSGGEKAISMYVPLFSAAVAKYSGARSDAPRIICLDEAFAGVDDRNIANMFKMMSDCKFQFILNSQSLWGDYDTNPGMAIYQLETDNNAKFVTTMPYIWNGKKTISLGLPED